MQCNLDLNPSYPHRPGFKTGGTSRDAAEQIDRTGASVIRERVLIAIRKAGSRGLTPDEAAGVIGETLFNARPRCIELKAQLLIKTNGLRRSNASGNAQQVLVACNGVSEAPSVHLDGHEGHAQTGKAHGEIDQPRGDGAELTNGDGLAVIW